MVVFKNGIYWKEENNMWEYNKEKDQVIECTELTGRVVAGHQQLNAFREALGLGKRDQKYTVQVMPDARGFLKEDKLSGRLFIDTDVEDPSSQTQFTQSEIDKVKQYDDIAIDWNKAIIKPVEDVK